MDHTRSLRTWSGLNSRALDGRSGHRRRDSAWGALRSLPFSTTHLHSTTSEGNPGASLGRGIALVTAVRALLHMALWKTSGKPDAAHVAAMAQTHILERVEALERKFKVVELEWEDMFDRFRRLHAKLARRQGREEAPTMPPEARSPNGQGVPRTTNPLAARLLSGLASYDAPRHTIPPEEET